MCIKFILLTMLGLLSLSSLSKEWTPKEKGLVWGSLYGDAFGGPYEFQKINPHRLIKINKSLKPSQWRELAKSVKLVDYKIKKSPYGPWIDNAPKGTITDDSRHKLIFWKSTKGKSPSAKELASSYFNYYNLNNDYKNWLSQYAKVACFTLDREHQNGLPQQRLWGGIATQAGQMIFLMNSLFFSNRPSMAYKNTYKINIFDNGVAMDYTSSIVGSLAYALTYKSNWHGVKKTLKNLDPYHYKKIPFVKRKLNQSIELAEKLVRLADNNPKKLFKMLEENLNAKTWWEADTAFTISYAFLEMTKDYPLAALALTREFGHDVDSYAQLIGAYLGAIYGEELFNKSEVDILKTNIKKRYEDVFREFE